MGSNSDWLTAKAVELIFSTFFLVFECVGQFCPCPWESFLLVD